MLNLGEKISDGPNLRKIQQCAQPEKEVSDGRNSEKNSATGATCDKSQWKAQPEKKRQRTTRATWKKRHVEPGKKPTMCANLKRSQRHAQPGKKSAMCATWNRSQRRTRPVKKSQRRAQPEKEVSEGLVLAGKNYSIGTTWRKITATRAGATCEWLARPVKKKSLTGTIWKRSQRRNRATRKKNQRRT